MKFDCKGNDYFRFNKKTANIFVSLRKKTNYNKQYETNFALISNILCINDSFAHQRKEEAYPATNRQRILVSGGMEDGTTCT